MAGVLHINSSPAKDEHTETQKTTTEIYQMKIVLCNIVKFVSNYAQFPALVVRELTCINILFIMY